MGKALEGRLSGRAAQLAAQATRLSRSRRDLAKDVDGCARLVVAKADRISALSAAAVSDKARAKALDEVWEALDRCHVWEANGRARGARAFRDFDRVSVDFDAVAGAGLDGSSFFSWGLVDSEVWDQADDFQAHPKVVGGDAWAGTFVSEVADDEGAWGASLGFDSVGDFEASEDRFWARAG